MAKQIKYTNEFRREAVEMYHKGNASASQVARKLGIHEHTMCRWIELYGKGRAVSAQFVGSQAGSSERYCTGQETDLIRLQALEYIHAIKRQVGALEQLLLQQTNCNKAAE